MSRLLDVLLSTEPVQRMRVAQTGLAMLLLVLGVAAMHYFAWVGAAALLPVRGWTLLTALGMLVFYALIRSGLSRRWPDPSLMLPQMVFALASATAAYTLLGPARGAVFPMVMVILMFGMFAAAPGQMRWVTAYAVLLFAIAMALMSLLQPARYPWRIELGHFLLVATLVPAVSLLAARLSRMRQRARNQRAELAQALARLRENTTRDELTGLVNRRQMQTLMAQEHQRCVRSGQTFCVAVFDIDNLKATNAAHGYPVGDLVLREVTQEALRHVRASDVLARWGGEEFALLMSDTRAPLARSGIERLQQRIAALRIPQGDAELSPTWSAGIAEHHAGETAMETLERAERALNDAKAAGRQSLAVAA